MKYQHIEEEDRYLLLPEWSDFSAEKSLSELSELLTQGKELIGTIVQKDGGNFAQIVVPLEEHNDKIAKCWGPVSHLNNVMQRAFPRLQQIHDEGAMLLSEYSTFIGMNKDLYGKYKFIKENQYAQLGANERKIIDDQIKEFEISGVALRDEQKKEYAEIQSRLTDLSNTFSNNVQAAQEHWSEIVADKAVLEGIPETTLASMKRAAEEKGMTGYLVTLHQPIYISVVQYAHNRALRERIYRASITRASDLDSNGASIKGQNDNTPIMKAIVSLRQQKARLLGYKNFNELSLARKMAETVNEVDEFYSRLIDKSKEKARQELNEIELFAKRKYSIDTIMPWDLAYLSEKLKQERFDVDIEALRDYFPEENVIEGLFELMRRLFGLQLRRRIDVNVWGDDVSFYELRDADGTLRGGVYADLYAREGKRPGAWMDIVIERKEVDGKIELPVAYFNCNFTKPVHGKVATLRHDEIETVFHEFGHVLHHIVGKMPYASLGMNGVEWDAIEYPSQILENWCWEEQMLLLISSHVDTKEKIPKQIIDNLRESKSFMIGNFLTRQLALGLYDWRLHRDHGDDPELDIAKFWIETWNSINPKPAPEWVRYAHTFLHIFDGAYAAGYFSYLWAEVLAADVYAEFKEKGIFDGATGERYLREVLEVGSSRSMKESFRAFRGRDPDPIYLLKQYDIE